MSSQFQSAPEVSDIRIHRVRLPKKALAKLTDEERFLFVVIGQILNEVSALHRLIVFASNYPDHPDTTKASVHASQATYFLRIFIGHLYEAHLFMNWALYGTPTGKLYRDRM
ncbi:MAG: hypothetical protein KIT36_10090, partial [Alphaproteobacteria bacterium]|nr:hypothetical protein [Alphaproteobacteria bacterium]